MTDPKRRTVSPQRRGCIRDSATLTVTNMRDHLRIVHRRRVSRDAPISELQRAWEFFHPADLEVSNV